MTKWIRLIQLSLKFFIAITNIVAFMIACLHSVRVMYWLSWILDKHGNIHRCGQVLIWLILSDSEHVLVFVLLLLFLVHVTTRWENWRFQNYLSLNFWKSGLEISSAIAGDYLISAWTQRLILFVNKRLIVILPHFTKLFSRGLWRTLLFKSIQEIGSCNIWPHGIECHWRMSHRH